MQQNQTPDYRSLAQAWPDTGIRAVFKQSPDDFRVNEELPFTLEGEGEHAWLLVEKRGSNTDWIARRLAQHAGVKLRQVSYAGLKDRHAVCRQWFSVHLPGRKAPDWSLLDDDEMRLVEHHRHRRKLQRGAIRQNWFEIRLRHIDGDIGTLMQRCELLAREGVPNYFGEQRFGRNMDNLRHAKAMFGAAPGRLSRHKRSLYLSAARSWIFNAILSQRITDQCWNSRLPGDVFMLQGSQACFIDDAGPMLQQRLQAGEIHPTAALWGEGESMAQADCAVLEQAVADRHGVLAQGLVDARLQQQRRATRLLPQQLRWQPAAADELLLQFSLPAGSYATAILRELGDMHQPPASKPRA